MGRPRIHARPSIDDTYVRLKVLGEAEPYVCASRPGQTVPRWWCQCTCGKAEPKMVRETHLTSGKITSCGCLHREVVADLGRANKGQERNGKLNSEQKQLAVARYEAGESGDALGAVFGVSDVAIRSLLKRRGVTARSLSDAQRRLALNEAAFSEVTEASAYWIGFLMADGAIWKNTLKLGLASKDLGHVQAFAEFLGAGQVVADRGTYADISINSARLVSDLARFGVVPRKSHTAEVIGLAENRHFWRGAVDGDGWIGLTLGKYAALHMHGSFPLMGQFLAFVQSVYPATTATVKAQKNIYRVALAGRAARAVVSALYEDATVVLSRKAETAKKVLAAGREQRDLLAAD